MRVEDLKSGDIKRIITKDGFEYIIIVHYIYSNITKGVFTENGYYRKADKPNALAGWFISKSFCQYSRIDFVNIINVTSVRLQKEDREYYNLIYKNMTLSSKLSSKETVKLSQDGNVSLNIKLQYLTSFFNDLSKTKDSLDIKSFLDYLHSNLNLPTIYHSYEKVINSREKGQILCYNNLHIEGDHGRKEWLVIEKVSKFNKPTDYKREFFTDTGVVSLVNWKEVERDAYIKHRLDSFKGLSNYINSHLIKYGWFSTVYTEGSLPVSYYKEYIKIPLTDYLSKEYLNDLLLLLQRNT